MLLTRTDFNHESPSLVERESKQLGWCFLLQFIPRSFKSTSFKCDEFAFFICSRFVIHKIILFSSLELFFFFFQRFMITFLIYLIWCVLNKRLFFIIFYLIPSKIKIRNCLWENSWLSNLCLLANLPNLLKTKKKEKLFFTEVSN